MIFLGEIIASLGATYLLLSTAHLATLQHQSTLTRLCRIAAAITLADFATKLLGIVNPAFSAQGLVQLPIGRLDLYPIMIATALMIGYTAAIIAFPWRWAATTITVILMVTRIVFNLLIPPVMAWQIRVEHETLLPRATLGTTKGTLLSTLLTLLLFLVLAIVLDSVVTYARRRSWSTQKMLRVLLIAALPVLLIIGGAGLASVHLLNAKQLAQGLQPEKLGIVVMIVSLLVMAVGMWIGQEVGHIIGQSLKQEVQ
jgi:hypothetical protein